MSPLDFDGPLASCRPDTRHGNNNKLQMHTLHHSEDGTVQSVLSREIGLLVCWLQSDQAKPHVAPYFAATAVSLAGASDFMFDYR